MKKSIYFGLYLGIWLISYPAFCQSNEEKAINLLDKHLQTMFIVLSSKQQTISPTCMDSLKKLHDFKKKFSKDTSNQREVNLAILRALYSNSIQFCETDVQAICSKRAEPSIRKVCKEFSG